MQRFLQQRLDDANRTFRPHLISRLTITLGDEYQGVFRTPQRALMAAFDIAEALSPIRLHHGLGIGGLSTPIDAKNPGRMDGPCFHHARAALQQSRRQKSWLTVSGISQPEDELVSSTLGLWGRVRESWTGRQREVVQAVQATEDQRKAAHDLHVSPPTVTRVLKAARYHELARAKTALIAFLGKPLPTEEASP